ncbi:RNA methyltransferase [Desulfonatronospira sp.]|uniref:TrmH family RNA methyltransferase n=1 Tax=Desulfonatronospira sp. TaxID=1962951 RepID=UPI0025BC3C66|nr:RNA methyltransferase [Desulfonatronospira sp.]
MHNEFRTDRRKLRVQEVLARRQRDLTLVLNNIHDPHNVAAILRSCDAFGVPEVHLLYVGQPFPEVGKKSSASARKWVGWLRHRDAEKMVQVLKGQGLNLIRTGFGPCSLSLPEWDFTRPSAVILGNEHSGVQEDLEQLVDQEIYIPMQGMVQSLNVSVAAAIILYEAFRQRHQAGLLEERALPGDRQEALYHEWIQK